MPIKKMEEITDEVQAQLKTLCDANFDEKALDKKVCIYIVRSITSEGLAFCLYLIHLIS